jgi:uncharacterized membrane protein
MASKAAITVNRPQEEVRRMWESSDYRPEHIDRTDAAATFKDAPGDRGTEIHLDLPRATRGGKLGKAVSKLFGAAPLAKVKDDLRHFKQLVETGEIARSDATPEGERAQRKLKQRPAQPLEEAERQRVGV